MTDTKNTVSDERLEAMLNAEIPLGMSIADARSILTELQSLRSAHAAVRVKVKPLEWSIERDGDALCWRASDPLGGWAYIRIHTDDEMGECSYASETFRTAAEAQASFEDNRERRILSALDLSPAEEVCLSCEGTGVDLYDGTAHDCQICSARGVYTAPSNPVISDEMVEREK